MTITQRGESWQVALRVNGVRYRKDFRKLADAEAYEASLLATRAAATQAAADAVAVPKAIREKQARSVKHDTITHFGPLVKEVLAKRWGNDPSYKTSLININTALAFFGEDYPLGGFDMEGIDSYIQHLEDEGMANGTINRKLTALNVCLKYAKDRRWIKEVPKMQRKTETGYRDRVITQHEEALGLAYFTRIGRQDLEDAFIVLLDTGLRVRVELLALRVAHVTSIPYAAVNVVGKGGKPRTVPLTARAHAAIKRRVDVAIASGDDRLFPMSYRTFLERWDGMAAALGLSEDKQFIPHICRHTCASRLADALVPAQQIQKWLGHTDITTTMRYVHASAASLVTGVSALEGLQQQHAAADNVAGVAASSATATKSMPQLGQVNTRLVAV